MSSHPSASLECAIGTCQGRVFAEDRCLGHLDDMSFRGEMARLPTTGGPLIAAGAKVSGDRVTKALAALQPGSGRINRQVDFSGATIEGDVKLTNVRLAAPVSFAGATISGRFLADTVAGLGHLALGPTAGQRTRLNRLEILDCIDAGEEWTLAELDVVESVRMRNVELRYLGLDRCRLGAVCSLKDIVLDTLEIDACAWGDCRAEHLRLSGRATVAASKCRLLTLLTSAVEGWADLAVEGSLEAERCRFAGPTRITLNGVLGPSVELTKQGPRRAVDIDGLTFDGAARELSLDSVRFESTAQLRWGSGPVLLPATLFGEASTLDQAFGASPPKLRDVAQMDGAKLAIKAVDLSACLLSGASTLGPVQPERLLNGRGGVGLTRRRYVADENEFPPRGSWQPWKWPVDARRKSAQNLAELYRDLRRKCEDSGNFAGANDLYYGERLWQRKATGMRTAAWLWLAGYGVVGYGVRPWRPFALLLALVLAATLAFGAVGGLEHRRVVSGQKGETQAVLCDRNAAVTTPADRQQVDCAADFGERLEFSVRTSTTLVRQPTGFVTDGSAAGIDIALRVLAATLFGLLVLAVRNRVHR